MYSQFLVVDFGSSRTGLGNVGYTPFDPGTGLGARVTAGISEIADGKYGAVITFADDFTGAILWDSGEVDLVYAVEVINPSAAAGAGSDPWAVQLPNSYDPHSAGAILAKLDIGATTSGISVTELVPSDVTTDGSTLLFPERVKSVIAAALDGEPLDIRNILFQYQQNGPTRYGSADMLIDEGERYFPDSGKRKRQYRLTRGGSNTKNLTFVAKLRWVRKRPEDEMTIRNMEALRLMCCAIVMERQEKFNEAKEFEMGAEKELDKELQEYLAGQQLTVPMRTDYWQQERIGGIH